MTNKTNALSLLRSSIDRRSFLKYSAGATAAAMTGVLFDWHGLRLEARCSGALWWPEGRWLIVADLHLGKSERMARRGGALLPPYEGRETLRRLAEEVAA